MINFRTHYEICPTCKGEGELQDPTKNEMCIVKCKRCNCTGKILVYSPKFYIEIPAGNDTIKDVFIEKTDEVDKAYFAALNEIAKNVK